MFLSLEILYSIDLDFWIFVFYIDNFYGDNISNFNILFINNNNNN